MFKFVVAFLCLLEASAVFADEPKAFEPANFKDVGADIQRAIQFPNSELKDPREKNLVIRCDAVVSRHGKIMDNYCYQRDSSEDFYIRSIQSAMRHGFVSPARVGGTPRVVLFQYYVVFMKKGSSHSVEVFPNSGLELKKYGLDYTSPQRYKVGGGEFGTGCGIKSMSTVNAIIDENGIPVSVDVVSDNAGEKCKSYLKKSFLAQKFIPAMLNGVPFKSSYSEVVAAIIRW